MCRAQLRGREKGRCSAVSPAYPSACCRTPAAPRYCYLQQPSDVDVTEFILDQFELLHRTYVHDRALIPPGAAHFIWGGGWGPACGVCRQWQYICLLKRQSSRTVPCPPPSSAGASCCSECEQQRTTTPWPLAPAHQALIPSPLCAGQLVEVRFADLERDPLGMLRHIYGGLSLPGFERVQPMFERYIGGLEMSGFKKNAHRWAVRLW